MRCFIKATTGLLLVAAHFLMGPRLTAGLVLCIGPDGHFGVEWFPAPGHGKASDPSLPPAAVPSEIRTDDAGRACCDSCLVDLPLADAPHGVRLSRPARPLAVASVAPLPHIMAGFRVPAGALHDPVPRPAPLRAPSAVLTLRTVQLLV